MSTAIVGNSGTICQNEGQNLRSCNCSLRRFILSRNAPRPCEMVCLTTASCVGLRRLVILVPSPTSVDGGVRLPPTALRFLGCGHIQLCALDLWPLLWAVTLSLAQQLLCRFPVRLARKACSTLLLTVVISAPECDMSPCVPYFVWAGCGAQQRKDQGI